MNKVTRLIFRAALVLVGGLLALSSSYAQEQQDENGKPKPAAHAPMIDQDQPQDQTDPNALHPDITPLTGVQNPGVGNAEFRHSYWVPGIQIANTAQSGGGSFGNSGDWTDTTYVSGNLSLYEAWAHSRLNLNYSGGGFFSTDDFQGNGSYQQLAFSDVINLRRWQIAFFDQFAYLPTSQFGFGGLSNIGAPGVGGPLSVGSPGLGNNFVPDQTVLTDVGPRYSNSFATEVTLETSRRGSLTLVGSIGILRFTNSGNVDNDDEIGSIGYNYLLSKKDSIGLLYRFSAFHFSGLPQAIGDHVFNVAYGRKVTGRLGLALFGGPEITTFRIPIGNGDSQTGVSVGGSLSYALERGGVTISYTHGTTGGSGVLAGAAGDQLTASGTRSLTRLWSARANFGYGRIHGFKTVSGIESPGYNTFYMGGGLDRPIGRNANVSFGYTAYIQDQNNAACLNCGISTQHQVSIGFQWHTRPFVLR